MLDIDIVICAKNNRMLQYNILEDPTIIKTICKDNNVINNINIMEMVTYYRV